MERLHIGAVGVDLSKALGCRAIGLDGAVFLLHLVRGVVIQVHVAGVRVVGKYVFVELGDLFELLDVLLLINVVFVHNIGSQFEEIDVSLPHVKEDWRSLNKETNIDAHHISGEHMHLGGVDIVLGFEPFGERLD